MMTPLRSGDLIALDAPASRMGDESIQRAVDALREKGFRTRVGRYSTDEYLSRFAGTDEQRADSFSRSLADPDVRAIFCLTGGYGASRMLHLVDWDKLKHDPKPVTGFSDITAIHMAIYRETGLPSFHSPNMDQINRLTDYTETAFWNHTLNQNLDGNLLPAPSEEDDDQPQTWISGTAEGVLYGGNLSLVSALEGTPHAMPKNEPVILFLEEVGEYPYRVDLTLRQLMLAGSLTNVTGVVVGQFTLRRRRSTQEEMQAVLREFFLSLGVPVIANAPIGHVRNNHTVAHGVSCRLDADSKHLSYLQNPYGP